MGYPSFLCWCTRLYFSQFVRQLLNRQLWGFLWAKSPMAGGECGNECCSIENGEDSWNKNFVALHFLNDLSNFHLLFSIHSGPCQFKLD